MTLCTCRADEEVVVWESIFHFRQYDSKRVLKDCKYYKYTYKLYIDITYILMIHLFASISFYFIWQVLTPQNGRHAPHQCRSQSRRLCLRSTISLEDVDISKHPSSIFSGWLVCIFWGEVQKFQNMKSVIIFGFLQFE